ncbi:MAG: tetratricopeptide repeat protein, partial [Pseudomonadales bacterium]|nr:tetratricopeptide repeat protein [Pseudomonadales bacterium]
ALMVISEGLINQMRLDEAFGISMKLLAQNRSGMFDLIANQAAEHGDRSQSESLLQRYNKTLENHPNAARLIIGKAILLSRLGRNDEAISSIRKTVNTLSDPQESAASYLLLSKLLVSGGELEQALSIIKKQVQKQPENPQLRFEYARLLTSTDLEAAKEQLLILLEKQPDNPETVLSLALVCKELNESENMLYYLYRLIYMGRFTDTAHLQLGEHALKTGNIPEAVEHFKRVENGREYLTSLQFQLEILLDENQLALADELINRHQQRYPEREVQLLLLQAEVLQSHSYFNESIAILDKSIKRFPENPDFYYSRSLALEKTGRVDESEQDLRHMLTLTPDSPMAMNALGYLLLLHKGPTAEAEALLSNAIHRAPDDAAIMDSYAWLLYKQGKKEEALALLKEAFLLFPNHEIAAHLGEVLWVNGHHNHAKTIWQKGIEDKADSPIIKETLERLGASLK